MATFAVQPADRQYFVGTVASFTTYPTQELARAQAQSLSASNSSAAYLTALVLCAVTAPGNVDLYPGNPGPETWLVQAASTTDYYPQATAIAQAYTTSAANTNAQTFVAWIQETCTGP